MRTLFKAATALFAGAALCMSPQASALPGFGAAGRGGTVDASPPA